MVPTVPEQAGTEPSTAVHTGLPSKQGRGEGGRRRSEAVHGGVARSAHGRRPPRWSSSSRTKTSLVQDCRHGESVSQALRLTVHWMESRTHKRELEGVAIVHRVRSNELLFEIASAPFPIRAEHPARPRTREDAEGRLE